MKKKVRKIILYDKKKKGKKKWTRLPNNSLSISQKIDNSMLEIIHVDTNRGNTRLLPLKIYSIQYTWLMFELTLAKTKVAANRQSMGGQSTEMLAWSVTG